MNIYYHKLDVLEGLAIKIFFFFIYPIKCLCFPIMNYNSFKVFKGKVTSFKYSMKNYLFLL